MALNGEQRTVTKSVFYDTEVSKEVYFRIRLFCVSPDIPVDRYYPLQLYCDALATGSVKVTQYG